MRVLFSYHRHKPGGFCKRLYRGMNALAERGHEVFYLTAEPPAQGLSPKVRVLPLVFGRPSGAFTWVGFYFLGALQAAFLSRRYRIDRLVAFGPFYSAMLKLASLVSGAPVVLFVRSRLGVSSPRGWIFDWMFQRADWIGLRCAKVVVVLTEVMKSYIQELLPRNSRATIVNLPNDINVLHPLVLSRAPKEKAYIALTLGAFSETKNLSFLLEAFSELRAFGSDAWQLKVVGRGDALAAFEAEVKSRGLTSIEVIPWVTQVDSLFEKAALLLHPSRHEGMPNVVLEAMAFGLPVLCADIPELRELMGDERCLMPINEPRALAERLLRMAEDPRLLQELGALIHRRAGELVFDWNGRFEQIVVNLR